MSRLRHFSIALFALMFCVAQAWATQVTFQINMSVQQDLGKGLALLESVLKTTEPAAQPFHPLARQLADNYQERMKLENQLEKQSQSLNQQLKDSQRKTAELQEKLDSLANIEKALIPRPRVVRPDGGKR